MAGVAIRELGSLDDLSAAIGVWDSIWAPDASDSSVRLDLLRALTKAENYASGAYDLATGAMLGACVGFFGPPAHAELHSHIAGVVPAGLGRSIGFALKVHQRAWCLRHDVRVIARTYDPLIRRNAYFNLVKLGARPAEYLPNFYGAMADAINGGTETDRMLVHWDLRSAIVAGACAGIARSASQVAEVARRAEVAEVARRAEVAEIARRAELALSVGADGWPVLWAGADAGATADSRAARTLLVGIPGDVETLRVTDPGCAGGVADRAAGGARAPDGWWGPSDGL